MFTDYLVSVGNSGYWSYGIQYQLPVPFPQKHIYYAGHATIISSTAIYLQCPPSRQPGQYNHSGPC